MSSNKSKAPPKEKIKDKPKLIMSEPGAELHVPNNHIKRSSRSLACRSAGNSPITNSFVSRKAFSLTHPYQPATEAADLDDSNIEINVTDTTRKISKTSIKSAKIQLGNILANKVMNLPGN